MLASAFELGGVCESYDLRIPLHRQTSLRVRILLPGSFVCHCLVIDHQDTPHGRSLRKGGVDACLPFFRSRVALDPFD